MARHLFCVGRDGGLAADVHACVELGLANAPEASDEQRGAVRLHFQRLIVEALALDTNENRQAI